MSIIAMSFVEPLLANKDFTKDTVLILTCDESKNQTNTNQVWSVHIGGAVKPKHKNVENTLYDHYYILATIEKNWKLPNLGQNDANATACKWKTILISFSSCKDNRVEVQKLSTSPDIIKKYVNCSQSC
jgi:hypothetical protein